MERREIKCSKCLKYIESTNLLLHDSQCNSTRISKIPSSDNSHNEIDGYKYCGKCDSYLPANEFNDHFICHSLNREVVDDNEPNIRVNLPSNSVRISNRTNSVNRGSNTETVNLNSDANSERRNILIRNTVQIDDQNSEGSLEELPRTRVVRNNRTNPLLNLENRMK